MSPLADIGWNMLTLHQQTAAKAAAHLLEKADLQFMTMLFSPNGVAAVVGNIEPADAVRLIEDALVAAKNAMSFTEMGIGRPN